MANYSISSLGTQSINTGFKTDLIPQHRNHLYNNFIEPGIVNNYTDVTISNSVGIVEYKEDTLTISWELDKTINQTVSIYLMVDNKIKYDVANNIDNTWIYEWTLPTIIDVTGSYTLKVIGNEDPTKIFTYRINIPAKENTHLKIKPTLSMFIKPNNQSSTISNSYRVKYEELSDSNKLKMVSQVLKMDTTDTILIKCSNLDAGIYYVIAEYNWIDDDFTNGVEFWISEHTSSNNTICVASFEVGDVGSDKNVVTKIRLDSNKFLLNQTTSTFNDKVTQYLNTEKLDGLNVGNESGKIPINNGILCENLESDTIDGYSVHNGIPVITYTGDDNHGSLISNLNCEYLGDHSITGDFEYSTGSNLVRVDIGHDYIGVDPTIDGEENSEDNKILVPYYKPGNSDGDIPLSNGRLNENLNAEMINGHKIEDVFVQKHTHKYNKSNITDGIVYRKVDNVIDNLITRDSCSDASFGPDKIGGGSIIYGDKSPLIVTGEIRDETLNIQNQKVISFGKVFDSPPQIMLQFGSNDIDTAIDELQVDTYIKMYPTNITQTEFILNYYVYRAQIDGVTSIGSRFYEVETNGTGHYVSLLHWVAIGEL